MIRFPTCQYTHPQAIIRFSFLLSELFSLCNVIFLSFELECALWVRLKVHMHEIFIVCFLNYFCIFQSLIDIKRSTANIFENILQIRPDIRNFRLIAVFAESAKHG
jgi:hypothetical protein